MKMKLGKIYPLRGENETTNWQWAEFVEVTEPITAGVGRFRLDSGETLCWPLDKVGPHLLGEEELDYWKDVVAQLRSKLQ